MNLKITVKKPVIARLFILSHRFCHCHANNGGDCHTYGCGPGRTNRIFLAIRAELIIPNIPSLGIIQATRCATNQNFPAALGAHAEIAPQMIFLTDNCPYIIPTPGIPAEMLRCGFLFIRRAAICALAIKNRLLAAVIATFAPTTLAAVGRHMHFITAFGTFATCWRAVKCVCAAIRTRLSCCHLRVSRDFFKGFVKFNC